MKFVNIINTKNKKSAIFSRVGFGILLLVLVTIFTPNVVFGLEVPSTGSMLFGPLGMLFSATDMSLGNSVASALFKSVGGILMSLSAFVLMLSGWLFDSIVDFSIIKMATNIGDPAGMGGAITNAWATLRDVANMAFIFVLLYAAFKAMFDANFGNFQTTIKNIIIVALLINFSLFFAKVVIDASNIVSVGFYNSITTSSAKVLGVEFDGISAGYVNMLRLQTFFSSGLLDQKLDAGQIFVVGLMSSIFMLGTAVVLLIAGIMFATRFIMLIFLMILSPLALIAYIIPGQAKKFEEWKDALIAQSFFAPLFFALTWVVFRVGTSLLKVLDDANAVAGNNTTGAEWAELTTNPRGAMALVVNYVLIMGLAIAALVISKSMASKTVGFTTITNTLGANRAAGVIGGVSLGGAAALGRRTIGAGASRLAQSQRLSNWAGQSWLGQKVKEGTEGVAKSSFDIRQTKSVGGALQKTELGSFGTGKAGGYDATLQSQITKKEKVVAGLKTDQAKQDYAARQLAGLSSYAKGGSSPNHLPSLFGTMGRSNRIVASKIFTNQITILKTDLSNGNTELTRYQNVLRGGGTLTPTQLTRYTTLTGPVGTLGSLADIQDKITTLQAQVGTLGVTNAVTGKRADQQNY